MMSIAGNIEGVREVIKEAALKSGRKAEDVLLLAVTKLHTPSEMNEAIDAGATDIGENKVQEVLEKYDSVKPVRWHLIGHLQTNKVRQIIDKVVMIHSVDSFHLAKEIDKRAGQAGITMDVLIQVDPADQETKFGVDPSDLDPLIRQISEECPNVRVKGLMCIAPFCEDPEDTRPFFREVKRIYDRCRESYEDLDNVDFQYLSMGMTNDFRIAVEEGSNLVRVGTAIFGYRDYRKEEK